MICRRAPTAVSGDRRRGGVPNAWRLGFPGACEAAARLLAGADYAAALLVRQALNHRLDPSYRRAAGIAILDRARWRRVGTRQRTADASLS